MKSSTQKRAPQLIPYHWKKGQSGNPGGRPKKDKTQEIAVEFFEKNAAGVYQAMGKKVLKGDTAAFNALADRGYGKAQQKVLVDGNIESHTLGRLAALLERAVERANQSSGSK